MYTSFKNYYKFYETVNVTVVFAGKFHSSVCCLGETSPPKTKPAVDVPAPPAAPRPVLKSAISVQEEPFHSSTKAIFAGGPSPPAANAAVFTPYPAPAKILLAVFKSPTSVHELPFHVSVFALAGAAPP